MPNAKESSLPGYWLVQKVRLLVRILFDFRISVKQFDCAPD